MSDLKVDTGNGKLEMSIAGIVHSIAGYIPSMHGWVADFDTMRVFKPSIQVTYCEIKRFGSDYEDKFLPEWEDMAHMDLCNFNPKDVEWYIFNPWCADQIRPALPDGEALEAEYSKWLREQVEC